MAFGTVCCSVWHHLLCIFQSWGAFRERWGLVFNVPRRVGPPKVSQRELPPPLKQNHFVGPIIFCNFSVYLVGYVSKRCFFVELQGAFFIDLGNSLLPFFNILLHLSSPQVLVICCNFSVRLSWVQRHQCLRIPCMLYDCMSSLDFYQIFLEV